MTRLNADINALLRQHEVENRLEAVGFQTAGGTSEAFARYLRQEIRKWSEVVRTKTVDYAIVLEGEIYAVMDEGETLMRAGDVLIQRGTNHAWANRSDKTARIAFVLIDGKREVKQ